ncbi:c-type cytochrome [Pseudomonas putida]|uniref:c-type cytochrome n=1 Tax=Pseudomonas putida TaxID=303 RepID=UPI001F51F50B|nr:cytochrome c [Pseudomonas putida]MCI0910987.1 cytochrome c [Pseudomonas putida]
MSEVVVDPDDRPFIADPATYQALHDGKTPTLGARIYADNCMACHRSDGKGYAQVFPALAGNQC